MRAILALLTIAVFAFADAFDDGVAAKDRGDHKKAITYFTQAIEIDPKDIWAYYNRGYSYAELGDYKKATEDARKACDLGGCDLLQFLDKNNQISD